MSLFISDTEIITIDLFIKRCGSNCECGRLLHRLYTSYLILVKELKKADYEAWERINERNKSYMGSEELPEIPHCPKQAEEEGDN